MSRIYYIEINLTFMYMFVTMIFGSYFTFFHRRKFNFLKEFTRELNTITIFKKIRIYNPFYDYAIVLLSYGLFTFYIILSINISHFSFKFGFYELLSKIIDLSLFDILMNIIDSRIRGNRFSRDFNPDHMYKPEGEVYTFLNVIYITAQYALIPYFYLLLLLIAASLNVDLMLIKLWRNLRFLLLLIFVNILAFLMTFHVLNMAVFLTVFIFSFCFVQMCKVTLYYTDLQIYKLSLITEMLAIYIYVCYFLHFFEIWFMNMAVEILELSVSAAYQLPTTSTYYDIGIRMIKKLFKMNFIDYPYINTFIHVYKLEKRYLEHRTQILTIKHLILLNFYLDLYNLQNKVYKILYIPINIIYIICNIPYYIYFVIKRIYEFIRDTNFPPTFF
jgi:hypothetical protein